jgi:2-polyprenyl-6-methoxyphenol hydroxylase-like FAD-dependent oxidoreductase
LGSVVRTAVLGERAPRSAGVTVWRGLSRGAHLVEAGVSREIWGRGRLFLAFGLSGDCVYWAASIRHDIVAAADETSPLEMLGRLYDGWLPLVRETIAATADGQLLKTELFDRPPSRVWGRGRITLLGDAAHPMTPHMGQGGAQALEDAVVLGRCVAESTNVETALRDYERARIKRANMFVRGSRAANDLAKLDHPLACQIRDTFLRAIPQPVVRYRLTRMLDARF